MLVLAPAREIPIRLCNVWRTCLTNFLQLAGSDRKEFLELIERVANQMPEERQRSFIRDIPRMTGMVE